MKKKPAGTKNKIKQEKKAASLKPSSRGNGKISTKSDAALKGDDETKRNSKPFPVVGIGASAGGVEAMSELLKSLDGNTGMAFVFILHLSPSHESMLVPILSRSTRMPVLEAEDKMMILPDHLFIIPPNKDMSIIDGVLRLKPRTLKDHIHLPINKFFLSLAEKQKERAIGILLSGNGSDGAAGLKAIKHEGGITFAQDSSAGFESMPKSAIAEGSVDLILTPKQIAKELSRLCRQKSLIEAINKNKGDGAPEHETEINTILQLLRKSTGVDFSLYKKNTISRRIIRRMILFKLENLSEYIKYLRQHTAEINNLYNDLLINVTTFFRDEDTWEYLKKNIIPKIIKSKAPGDPIRLWIPACSTGEEVYSLAMLFVEVLGDKAQFTPIQLFGTDLSDRAIAKARLGIYTKADVMHLPASRIQQFFTKSDSVYRINKNIRDLCVFAQHNLLRDPPFTRLDMASCCNLMIYLDNVLQKKIFNTLHYALNPGGFLLIGKSETIQNVSSLFTALDKKVKIYQRKKDVLTKAMFDASYQATSQKNHIPALIREKEKEGAVFNLEKSVDKLLLNKYVPASVVINEDLEILQFRGSTGFFLEPSPGKASLNLLKMAKPGIAFDIQRAVHKANKTGKPFKKTGIEVRHENAILYAGIEVVPLSFDSDQKFFLVLFTEIPVIQSTTTLSNNKRAKQLEEELITSREDMRSLVEEQQAINEELQSANEEIVSSNEELQSINEELETSKEEVESTNEELVTINSELQTRNEQLSEANDYAEMLLDTIRESAIILDMEFRIISVNRTFFSIFNIKEENLEGTFFFDLSGEEWNIEPLRNLLLKVAGENEPVFGLKITQQFAAAGEKVLLLNARKILQKTHPRKLIVLAIEDITDHETARKIIEKRETWYRNLLEAIPAIGFSFSANGKLLFLNKRWYEYTGTRLKVNAEIMAMRKSMVTEDARLFESQFVEARESGAPFEGEFRFRNTEGEFRWHLLRALPNKDIAGEISSWTGTILDVHDRHLTLESMKEFVEKIRNVLNSLPLMAWTADRDGNVDFVNRTFVEYTGIRDQRKMMQNLVPIIHPSDLPSFEHLWSKHYASGKPLETRIRVKRKSDGQYRWQLVRITPFEVHAGEQPSWVGTKTDIHDQKIFTNELEERVHERTELLVEANKLLEQSNAELQQFAYVASHDLQEPLRKIMLFSNKIRQRFRENKPQDIGLFVDKIAIASTRMSTLISDLLNYSRSDKNTRAFRETDLNTIVKDVLIDFDIDIKESGAKVVIKNLPVISAIPLQMTQLFHNLLSNALKFANDTRKPEITISSKKIDAKNLPKEFVADKNNKYIEIVVCDNGIGFDKKYAEQIFAIFQRLHEKQVYPGTGIGLALCKRIALNHEGFIYAEPGDKFGASFHVILPVKGH